MDHTLVALVRTFDVERRPTPKRPILVCKCGALAEGKGNYWTIADSPDGALATTATNGFTYLPTSAGAPTGVPTTVTGAVAFEFDTTNNKLMVYDGAWIGVALAGFDFPKHGNTVPILRLDHWYDQVEDFYDETLCPDCGNRMRPGEAFGLIGDSYKRGRNNEIVALHSYGAHLGCALARVPEFNSIDERIMKLETELSKLKAA